MANLMKMKRSSVPGKVPTTADLDLGEIAINTYDGKVYMKKNVSGVETIVLLTGAGAGDVLGPASSADNAIARFDGTSGKIIQNSGATIDDSGNVSATSLSATGTGANRMPVGTTAQRPTTPSAGMYRLNSTTKQPEWFSPDASDWVPFYDPIQYNIEYLIVAGGGGGGGASSGSMRTGSGGGAGGYISSSATIQIGTSYPIVIGAGGTSAVNTAGSNGSNSSFNSQTAIGGGGGVEGQTCNGLSGGSGGGGGAGSCSSSNPGGSGTSGQGNAGGFGNGTSYYRAGGGGGAGAAGTNPTGGNGNTWLDGVTRAGGGGAGGNSSAGAGNGGTGGGGGGGNPGGSGNPNSGGGGGGGNGSVNSSGGSGGSGVVIIRYLGAQRGSGGTVTSAGGYTYHTFTTSGSFIA